MIKGRNLSQKMMIIAGMRAIWMKVIPTTMRMILRMTFELEINKWHLLPACMKRYELLKGA